MNLQTADWNNFRTFYHVAKSSSLVKAAEKFHISQPALSRRIASLEESLKMRLLERTPRGIIPTEEGKTLLEMVDTMLQVVLSYGEKMDSKNEAPQGLLKISLPKFFPSLTISQWTLDFLKAYPHMRLAFMEGAKEIDFKASQVDAGIREFDEEAQDVEQVYLTTTRVGLYASVEYLQQYGIPQNEEALEQHRLIALGDPDPVPSYMVNRILKRDGGRRKDRSPYLCLPSLTEMKGAVKGSLGIAALPEEYATDEKFLIRVLPERPPLLLDLYYVYPTYHKQTKRITTYGTFLAERFKALKTIRRKATRDLNGLKVESEKNLVEHLNSCEISKKI